MTSRTVPPSVICGFTRSITPMSRRSIVWNGCTVDDEPVVAHVEPGADELVDRERVIALSRLADKAWPLDDFGRGKTAHRDRMRHALTLRITDGRTHHLNEISLVEADRIEKGLVMIVCGDVSWEATGEALVITSPDGMRAEYPWVETAGAN